MRYLSRERMKNITLCERFGIDPSNAAQASGIIKRALDLHRFRSGQVLMLSGPLFEGHG
jgi:ATP-dependent DNA helicase RecG